MTNDISFEESQRFTQWWLWLLFLGLNIFSWYLVYVQLICQRQSEQLSVADIGVTGGAFAMLLATALMASLRLVTLVKDDGIYFRFAPFHRKQRHYSWDELEQCYVRTYKPVREYGGWGIRGFGNNRALNVAGNVGLQLKTTKGAKMLLGTQRGKELEAVLRSMDRYVEE